MDSSVSPVRRVAAKVGILRTLARYRSRSTPDAVFVWIPKAAGTSISTALASATGSCLTLLSPGQVTACFPQRGLVTFGHQSYGQLVDEGYIDHEFDRRSFKFCFVRNPFDRTVSLFHYLRKKGCLHQKTSFRTFC